MFIVKPENPNDWAEALFKLSYYHVSYSIHSNGENVDGMYMVVEKQYNEFEQLDSEEEAQLRLAESAFQCPDSNWHTDGRGMCEVCRDDEISVCVDCDIRYSCDDSRDDCQLKNIPPTCGHLTFVKPVKGAF